MVKVRFAKVTSKVCGICLRQQGRESSYFTDGAMHFWESWKKLPNVVGNFQLGVRT